MTNWVEQEAKRNNRNLMIVNVLILGLGALAVVAMYADTVKESNYLPVIIVAGILLLALWNIFKALRRMSEVQITPLWKQVALYGEVQQMSAQLEQELLAPTTKYRSFTITPSWIVRKGTLKTWVSPLGDLAWAYKKITKHYTNMIPTGKSYAVVIVGRHRQRIEVSLPQKKTDALLAELAARVPWAFVGFSKELADAWQKNPQGIIAAVDSRYQQWKSKTSSAGTS